jgi:catechol 2,3-dioxygenase-like lactoylglutathione lyase family enzyme
LVDDLAASLRFWTEILGFAVAYQRPENKFVYLDRPEAKPLSPQRKRHAVTFC